MKIFKVCADHDKYDACGIDFSACAKDHPGTENYDMLFHLDGTPVASTWWPRKMKRYDDAPLGDYISKLSGDVLIMRRTVIEILRPVLGNIEILPLDCDFGDYWAVNILDVLDCIDYNHAEVKRFPKKNEYETPRIMRFINYAFHPDKIQGHHVFKIVDCPKAAIFVDETFLNEIAKHDITGFKCKLVWES